MTRTALAILMICLYYFGYIQPWIEKNYIYPNQYNNLVVEAAQKNSLSPDLIMAVILAESKSQIDVKSAPGALGLMQIMPDTAKWVQEQRGQKILNEEELKRPENNIAIGSWYLGHLWREFEGNKILALAAYNAGHGHVLEWIEKYHWDKNFNNIDEIPFPETREYIKKVLNYEKEYQRIYGNK